MAEVRQLKPRDRSLGELLGDLSDELSRLVRLEIQLARTEISEKLNAAGKAAAYYVVAGVAGAIFLWALSLTAIYALDLVLSAWLSALIVGVVWGVIGLIFFFVARGAYNRATPPVPEQTIETLKEDATWARRQRTSDGR